MATLLYRLGKASFRQARWVLVAWLVAFIGVGGAGVAFGGQTEEEFQIPGSESQEAFVRLEAVFPTFAGASAQVVLTAPPGTRLDDQTRQAYIEAIAVLIEGDEGVEDVSTPFDEFAGRSLSDDGSVAILQVRFDRPSPEISDAMVATLLAHRGAIEATGLGVEFGGSIFQDQTVGLTIAEVFGVIFAGIVLVVTFRSFRPSWIPLTGAIIGVGVSIGIILLLAHTITVSSSAPLLAVMLGLAVGIDYSLFIVSRHRTQLARGADAEESAGIAVGTAGNAVVFAGVTVIIALLGLFVVGIPFLSVMGAAAAIGVTLAIAVSITLVPAFFGLAGESLRPAPDSRAWQLAHAGQDSPSMGRRWVRQVTKRPLVTAIGSVAVLGTIAFPATALDLNLPGGAQEPPGSTQRIAYDTISDSFGPGFNGPLLISADITTTDDIMGTLEDLRAEFEAIPGVESVSEGFPSPGLDTGIFQVVPEFAPDSIETKALVADIRSRSPQLEETYDTELAVTGITAIGVDVSERIQGALLPFGVVVVGLSIILLLSVFRSILVPIKAALGFVLSVTAAFGVVVAIFQWGWLAELFGVETPGPILSFMPIILMAVLFGLAMDYEVFLVSGMREQHVRTGDWRFAIEDGYATGARVVTAAALIMFFVFFSFVVEGSNLIKPIALGLAVGIAFDAFIVRMTLVPAVMALFRERAWSLPSWLGRRVPEADVEGEGLRHHIQDREWASLTAERAAHGEYVLWDQHTEGEPVSFEWSRGDRIDVVADAPRARAMAGVLSGLIPPHSGALHVLGHPLPSESSQVRKRVTVWNPAAAGPEDTVGGLLEQRILWSARGSRLTREARARMVRDTLHALNDHVRSLSPDRRWPTVTKSTPVAELPRPLSILVNSALATIDGSPLVIVHAFDPVPTDEERLAWWSGLALFAAPHQAIALVSLPPARSLTPLDGHQILDLSATRVSGVLS